MIVKRAVLALYQLAYDSHQIHTLLASLETVHQELNESMIAYLDAPTIALNQKQEVVQSMDIDAYTKGFFLNLIKQRSVHQFEDIYQGVLTYMRELDKIYMIDVFVAQALTNDQKAILEKQLIHYFQASKVILNEHLDKNVMGGLKIMYQKQSLDQTVIQQFHQMEMMI